VDQVISHSIQSARDNIAELYDLHCVESDAECFEFNDSPVADNMYLFAVAECVEGVICGQNRMQRYSNAANEWPTSTLHSGGHNPWVNLYQMSSSGK